MVQLTTPFNWLSACKGKVRHLNKASAKRHVNELYSHNVCRKKHKFDIYQCSYCGYWHVGHKPGTKPGILKGKDQPEQTP